MVMDEMTSASRESKFKESRRQETPKNDHLNAILSVSFSINQICRVWLITSWNSS